MIKAPLECTLDNLSKKINKIVIKKIRIKFPLRYRNDYFVISKATKITIKNDQQHSHIIQNYIISTMY